MKYYHHILPLLLIIAFTSAQLTHENLKIIIGNFLRISLEHKQDCIEDAQISEDLVNKFWNHEYTGENDQKLKCYLKCSYLRANIMDEKGVLLVESLIHQIVLHHPVIIQKLTDHCKNPTTTDVCEAAYQITQCGFKWIMDVT